MKNLILAALIIATPATIYALANRKAETPVSFDEQGLVRIGRLRDSLRLAVALPGVSNHLIKELAFRGRFSRDGVSERYRNSN